LTVVRNTYIALVKPAFRKLLLRNLTQKLKSLPTRGVLEPPAGGWLRSIRLALGMPARYPAEKLGLARQAIEQLERNEATSSITLKMLKRAADALDCDLVYAVVPRAGSLDDALHKQALKQARKIVAPVAHSMLLESQATASTDERVSELAKQLAAHPKAALWTTD
jgi:predicted DNA-binding mobile mystery protein A